MSEHEPSIGNNVSAIIEALGATEAIYVGRTNVLNHATGVTLRRVELAKQAREIAERAEPGDPIGQTIGTLAKLVDPGPKTDSTLTDEQRDAIADDIVSLTLIHQRRVPTGDHASVIRGLYNTYFDYQRLLTETPAAGYLRNLGDDYALATGFSLDATWQIYQDCLQQFIDSAR